MIAVLASGEGTNFQALLDADAAGQLHATIALLLTNNPQARAIERAQRANIPHVVIPNHRDRNLLGTAILDALQATSVQLLCLAGFMRVLAPAVIAAYPRRILNIHPALLPKFPGLHAVQQALTAGVTETGCTVHLVDEGIDTGPIILQERVPILPGDTEASLAARIHAVEHRVYPRAVKLFLSTATT
ncbi:MAG: phosphoribosylglycinamide formyltransferase [Deltaproteobacteria bacterium]|nr:phosphoribosylglycinamide formyltransferase [Deltaproteobacteria bacterium]